MKKNATEKGLTLVEVLAAVAILGIVFVGIMTIFPQMTLFNHKTEVKLHTLNLARQEMASINASHKWEKILLPSVTDENALEPDFLTQKRIDEELTELGYAKQTAESLENTPYSSDSFVRYQRDGEYRYVTDIYLQCEPFLVKEATPAGPGAKIECAEEDRIKLHKVHVKLYSNKNTNDGSYHLSSETYSYIRYTAKKPAETVGGG